MLTIWGYTDVSRIIITTVPPRQRDGILTHAELVSVPTDHYPYARI